MWKNLINGLPIFSLCLHYRHCSSVSLNYLTELLNLEVLSISNSGTTSLVCQIHEKDFSKTFIELSPTRSAWAETGVQEKVILSPIVEPANNKNSGFSAEAGAGCAFGGSRLQQERERVGGGIFETRHRLRPPREGRNDWGSKFRRPTLPAHPYSGFHTLEPLHTLYLLIPKPLDSTYPSSSRRWPILSIFTSS